MTDNEREQANFEFLEKYFMLPEEQRYEFTKMIELYDDLTQEHNKTVHELMENFKSNYRKGQSIKTEDSHLTEEAIPGDDGVAITVGNVHRNEQVNIVALS